MALGRLWLLTYGQPILSAHAAEHVITSLDPWTSGTIVFAAITGVVLWLSSLAGGWVTPGRDSGRILLHRAARHRLHGRSRSMNVIGRCPWNPPEAMPPTFAPVPLDSVPRRSRYQILAFAREATFPTWGMFRVNAQTATAWADS